MKLIETPARGFLSSPRPAPLEKAPPRTSLVETLLYCMTTHAKVFQELFLLLLYFQVFCLLSVGFLGHPPNVDT